MDETLALLARSARGFLAARSASSPSIISHAADRARWRRLAAQGWLSIFSSADDNPEGGMTHAAVIARELGRAGSKDPYVASLMSAVCIDRANRIGPWDVAREFLLAGDLLVALAHQGSMAAEVSVWAGPHPNGYSLSGEARFVPIASADAFIVVANSSSGPMLFWIERDQDGLRLMTETCADDTQMLRLTFEGAIVSATCLMSKGVRAEGVLRQALNIGLIGAAAELLGLMDRSLELTLEYLGTRTQFGAALGSFQALQHRAVNLWMLQQITEAAVLRAAAMFDDASVSETERTKRAIGVKARASQSALTVASEALQLHGAIGFTAEYALGSYVNRMLVLSAWLGDTKQLRAQQGALRADPPPPPAPANISSHKQEIADWNVLDDEEFRSIVRSEFETYYPKHIRFPPRRLRWSENREWFLRMSRKGWIAPNWPRSHGGMGLDGAKLLIFYEEQDRCGIARYQDHGVLMVGPVLMRFGTENQRERFLPAILSCDHIWCQGYSEPNAGSDLASLRTRAVLESDEFVVTGQKIWTTLAHDATHIFMLVRTDPDAKPQRGISFLLVDIKSPGITVRPIRDIAGHEEFCEVFFNEVRVPRSNLVGGLNEGWNVAKSLLGFERIMLGSPKQPEYALQVLLALAQAMGVGDDPIFRDQLANLELDVAHLGDLYERFAAIASRGETLGPEVSMLKIVATETFKRIADTIVEVAGPFGSLKGALKINGMDHDVLAPFYKSRPATVYGGGNEIQRNIIAKQVLHLPG